MVNKQSSGEAPTFDPVRLVATRTGCQMATVTSKALTGGYLNQVYRVTGPFGDWVVKKFKEDPAPSLFPNLGRAEARALSVLGPLGISPRLVDFIEDADHGMVLIYSFHPGEIWPGEGIDPDAAGLASVARLLRQQHQLTVDGFRIVPVMPADILDQGDQFLALSERTAELNRLRPAVMDCPVLLRRSLLHTDVGPGNLITGPQGLRLIDWQCPALGDAAEDLCAFLSPAFQILYGRPPLTAAQRASFLTSYGDHRGIERLHLLEPFYHWRMAAYCGWRQQHYRIIRPTAAAAYAEAYAALLALLAR